MDYFAKEPRRVIAENQGDQGQEAAACRLSRRLTARPLADVTQGPV